MNGRFNVLCTRIVLARQSATVLLQRMEEPTVCIFVAQLGRHLENILSGSLGSSVSYSKRKEKMWTQFYKYRSDVLISSWKAFIEQLTLPVESNDLWLIQVIARICLEKCIEKQYPVPSPAYTSEKKQLTIDEHNALRYTAGFVMASLSKRYASTGCLLLERWVKNQSEVDNAPIATSSFFQFTKEWVDRVNRGGLFVVNNALYDVFHSLEVLLSEHLKNIPTSHGLDQSKVVSLLCEDNEVQFLWSTISFDLDEETSQRILMDIVKLWITLRGFSYASALVEEYKRATTETLQHSKALRKELKKSSDLCN